MVREGASLVHAGQGPRALSLLRDLALNLLRLTDVAQIAATMRTYNRHPDQAVTLVTQLLTRA